MGVGIVGDREVRGVGEEGTKFGKGLVGNTGWGGLHKIGLANRECLLGIGY